MFYLIPTVMCSHCYCDMERLENMKGLPENQSVIEIPFICLQCSRKVVVKPKLCVQD